MNSIHYSNVCKLLQYLRSCLDTPKGAAYNHSTYATCTFGFAAKSGLFPELGWEINDHHNLRRVDVVGVSQNESYTESSERMFGYSYTTTIVRDNNTIFRKDKGNDQLRAAISEVESFLRNQGEDVPAYVHPSTPKKKAKAKTVPQPKPANPATAGKRIEARIARLRKIEADIAKLGDDGKHFTINTTSLEAQIASLTDALNS